MRNVHNSTFFSVDQRTETQLFLVCLSFNKFYFVLDHTDFFMLTKTCLTLAQVPQDVGWHPPKMLCEGIFLAKPFRFQLFKDPLRHCWVLISAQLALCFAVFFISANYAECFANSWEVGKHAARLVGCPLFLITYIWGQMSDVLQVTFSDAFWYETSIKPHWTTE